jgi:DNA-binding beta-propeller fold protein YncE
MGQPVGMRAVLALACLSMACHGSDYRPRHQSTSSVALSQDDRWLYVVETDSASLSVIDTLGDEKIAEVRVGAGAHLVLVGANDTAYVANRLDRSISVVRSGAWSSPQRWEAGVEPVGLALSADARLLYVVSAVASDTATHGEFLAIDAQTGELRWQLPLGPEPRSVAVVDASHAVVTQRKAGEVTWVDLSGRQIISVGGSSIFAQLNARSSPQNPALQPLDMTAVALKPDGEYVFALATLAREGPHDGSAACIGTLVAPVAFLRVGVDGAPAVEDLHDCMAPGTSAPAQLVADRQLLAVLTPDSPWVQEGGSAIAFEENDAYAYVAHPLGNAVSWTHTTVSFEDTEGWHPIAVGRYPDGLAIKRDSSVGYVHNALDHTVMKLSGDLPGKVGVFASKTIPVGSEVLPVDVVEGRKLFFSAVDRRLTSGERGVACATCHLDGQEDGHVWRFVEGLRQTPSLVGGRLSGTAPYHWSGDAPTLEAAVAHAVARVGGTGISGSPTQQLVAFLQSLSAPVNPTRLGPPSQGALRGEAVFHRAGCDGCHSGEKLTDNASAHVGTDESDFPDAGVNVPSLLGLARSAPYLHDGSAPTLRDRLELGSDRHGQLRGLAPGDLDDLVEYLERL